jgi:hypothetical protein
MNMKKLPLLAVILAVVIGIIIVANQLTNQRPSEKSLSFIPQFSEAECGMISIGDASNTVYLVHKGKEWLVADKKPGEAGSPLMAAASSAITQPLSEYPADSSLIQTALDKLKTIKKDDLISQNPAKQAELEVDSAKALKVDVYNEKLVPVSFFYIGKNGADWNSNFVRLKGSNDVYLVGGGFKSSFFTDKSRWKNKTIVKFDRGFARGIEIAKKDSASILLSYITPSPTDTAVKPHWQINSPVKDSAKNTEVDKILNALSSFSAADFEANSALSEDTLGFTKPMLRVTVSLENGEKKIVTVGNEKGSEGKLWVRTPDKPVTFLVNKYTIESIDRSVNALRGIEEKKPEAKPFDAKKAGKQNKVKPAKPAK